MLDIKEKLEQLYAEVLEENKAELKEETKKSLVRIIRDGPSLVRALVEALAESFQQEEE